jgi:protein O-mannosyl-transferase
VLILASFVAYWPAMRNSFVWDDTALVLRDPLIRHWRLTPHAFQEFLFLDATASNFYRPLQRVTYTLDYALWGIDREAAATGEASATAPGTPPPPRADPPPSGAPKTGDAADEQAIQRAAQPGWHFTSILLHALAAVAFWRLWRVWLGDGWGALSGALVWAVHPLHTSAVTYVSGRADSLAAIFIFCALRLVARAHEKGGLLPGDRAAARQVIGATIFALAALLSKESGVAALTLWLVWVLFKARTDRRAWLSWLGASAIVLAAYLGLRFSADQTPVPPSTRESSLVMRPVLAARALAEYATLLVAPHSLHMERDVSIKPGDDAATVRFRHLQTAGGVLVAIALLLWARWAMRRAPEAALALACFAITWLPISNFFKLNATVAEHWLYVPSAFLIAAAGATFARVKENATLRRWLIPAWGAWVMFLGVQTWFQQDYWREQNAFIKETAARAGASSRLWVNIGQIAARQKNDAEARRCYEEALKLDPRSEVALFNLATLSFRSGDHEGTLTALERIKGSPQFEAPALIMRANIVQKQTGQPQWTLLAQAVDAAPRNWDIARRFAEARLAAGLLDRAYDELIRQNGVRPYRSEAYRLMAEILEAKAMKALQSGNAKAAQALLDMAAHAYGDAANCDVRDEVSRKKLAELRETL